MHKTKIPWCDYTWNPISGCTRISEGCDHCYAHTWAQRFRGGKFPVEFHRDQVMAPYRVKKSARIFVNSMSDLFHEVVTDVQIDSILMTMAMFSWHTFIVLTKRPKRMKKYFQHIYPPDNCWIGVSAETQKRADERIPVLLDIPAAVRFVSCEPLLEEISLDRYLGVEPPRIHPASEGLTWVICGPETGAGKRPYNERWRMRLETECDLARVAFFDKGNKYGAREWPE